MARKAALRGRVFFGGLSRLRVFLPEENAIELGLRVRDRTSLNVGKATDVDMILSFLTLLNC